MLRNLSVLLIAFVVSFISLSMVQAASTAERTLGSRLLKKASKPVEWEDLGFAWGKRSAPNTLIVPQYPQLEQLSLQRFVRSMKADKKANDAQWEDLGWAWGRK